MCYAGVMKSAVIAKKKTPLLPLVHASEERRAKAIFESIGDGVFVVNKKLRIIDINAAALHLLHKQRASCITKPYSHLFTFINERKEKIKDPVRQFLRKIFRASPGRRISPHKIPRAYIHIKRAGNIPVSINVTAFYRGSGTIFGGVIIMRDVTTETEIERAQTEFVSIASHQLSAPLAAIRWNIEMLLNKDAGIISEKQQVYLVDVLESNRRMIRLVNDLLNVSRLEEGRMRVDPQPVNLFDLVRDVFNEYERFRRSLGCSVDIVWDTKRPPPIANTDPILIRQVLNNLVVNAIQYSSPSHSKIIATIEKRSIDYKISLWDNGIGIPREAHKKIFSKFYRADNAQIKDAIGSGLGLYIAKMLVTLLGGKIAFRSHPKEGTVFFFTIPLSGSIRQKGEKTLALNVQ